MTEVLGSKQLSVPLTDHKDYESSSFGEQSRALF